jgi:hypothetical protein
VESRVKRGGTDTLLVAVGEPAARGRSFAPLGLTVLRWE